MGREALSTEVWLQATGYRAHVLMFSYIGLVIFAHAAHARVGKENFHYVDWPREIVAVDLLADPPVASLGAEPDST